MNSGISRNLSILLLGTSVSAFAADGEPNQLPTYVVHPQVVTSQEMAAQIESSGHSICYISFVTGEAQLDSASKAQVWEIAQMLHDEEDLRIEVSLQSPETGSARKLAYARAAALVNALRSLEVPSKRIAAAPSSDPTSVAFNELIRRE